MKLVEKVRDLITTGVGDGPEPQDSQPEPVQDQFSDEGRVLRLLVENDGQVRRSELLEETGWEPDRAETILAEMEESDQIRILSRGGSVLICRPGYEPEGHQRL